MNRSINHLLALLHQRSIPISDHPYRFQLVLHESTGDVLMSTAAVSQVPGQGVCNLSMPRTERGYFFTHHVSDRDVSVGH